jgi:hypothetical protein
MSGTSCAALLNHVFAARIAVDKLNYGIIMLVGRGLERQLSAWAVLRWKGT